MSFHPPLEAGLKDERINSEPREPKLNPGIIPPAHRHTFTHNRHTSAPAHLTYGSQKLEQTSSGIPQKHNQEPSEQYRDSRFEL